MKDIASFDIKELTEYVTDMGQPKFRAGQIYAWIHNRLASSFDEMTDQSKEFRKKLFEECELRIPKIVERFSSKDGTKKYLLKLKDGVYIESVLMDYEHGKSLCVSTQAGCAMECIFCASTKGGFERNLTASEIAGQIYAIAKAENVHIGHVVYMGMGEPLINYDNVIRAIRLLASDGGQKISPRNMTISTCGIVPGIERLSKEGLGITLALSLHAPTQEKREEIMPIAKTYHIDSVLEACQEYRKATGRRVTYEYCLIPGVNDTQEDVRELLRIFKGSDAHINIIPCHKIREITFEGRADAVQFKNKLEKNRINVTIRRELGQDIDASCGQLRLNRLDKD